MERFLAYGIMEKSHGIYFYFHSKGPWPCLKTTSIMTCNFPEPNIAKHFYFLARCLISNIKYVLLCRVCDKKNLMHLYTRTNRTKMQIFYLVYFWNISRDIRIQTQMIFGNFKRFYYFCGNVQHFYCKRFIWQGYI